MFFGSVIGIEQRNKQTNVYHQFLYAKNVAIYSRPEIASEFGFAVVTRRNVQ